MLRRNCLISEYGAKGNSEKDTIEFLKEIQSGFDQAADSIELMLKEFKLIKRDLLKDGIEVEFVNCSIKDLNTISYEILVNPYDVAPTDGEMRKNINLIKKVLDKHLFSYGFNYNEQNNQILIEDTINLTDLLYYTLHHI